MFENATNGDPHKLIKKCNNRLPESIVNLFFAQLVNYNQYMQEQGVMHRDLKPANIFIDNDGDLKIGDLGLSR